MFNKKKANPAIDELKSFINSCSEKIAKCKDLGQYMAEVRAPLNLRLVDLALGIQMMQKGDKKSVRVAKTLKDEEALTVIKLVNQFITEKETPFLESLVVPDEGIPLVQGIEMPKDIKKNKKGIISMVFRGSDSASPLCQQLLSAAAVQELIVFGKEFHKKVLRNRILIGAGATIAIAGIATATYFLVIKKHQDEEPCHDCYEGHMDMDNIPVDGIDLDTPVNVDLDTPVDLD